MEKPSIKQKYTAKLHQFRRSLAYIDALPQLTFLGLIIGLFTGAIIAAFRLLIESSLSQLLVDTSSDFESIPPMFRVILIFTGSGLLAALLYSVKKHQRVGGVGHVIDRLHNHQGHLPKTNWLVQFAGASISIISGQSVGREGPAVHLGAGAASQLGQWLKLPNNSMNTLIGCGVASAIATSFNTPLAGVIFAMEVIVREYTIVGFVPVILASVMGTMLSRVIFSAEGDIHFIEMEITSLMEMPYMVLVGVVISLFASSYTRLHVAALKFSAPPLYVRLFIAATLTSTIAIFVPEVMGLGYDTINQAILGKITIEALIIIALAKLIVTPVVIGLGVPGGMIGPALMIGACVGAALGLILDLLLPELGANSSFYVLMGMAGMMAAVINAPLAALVAVMELSYNPNSIFPAMLVIVVACVCTRQFFKVRGVFMEQLLHNNKTLDFGPAKQALRRAGVQSVMNTRLLQTPRRIPTEAAIKLLSKKPSWLTFSDEENLYALRAPDLAHFIESGIERQEHNAVNSKENNGENIDLLSIPAKRYQMATITDNATLLEALKTLQQKQANALCVSSLGPNPHNVIQGIVTLEDIQNYYQPEELKSAVD